MITIGLNIVQKINMAFAEKIEEKLKGYIGHLTKEEIKKRCAVKHTPPFKKEYFLDGKFLFLSDVKYSVQDKTIDIIISEKQHELGCSCHPTRTSDCEIHGYSDLLSKRK